MRGRAQASRASANPGGDSSSILERAGGQARSHVDDAVLVRPVVGHREDQLRIARVPPPSLSETCRGEGAMLMMMLRPCAHLDWAAPPPHSSKLNDQVKLPNHAPTHSQVVGVCRGDDVVQCSKHLFVIPPVADAQDDVAVAVRPQVRTTVKPRRRASANLARTRSGPPVPETRRAKEQEQLRSCRTIRQCQRLERGGRQARHAWRSQGRDTYAPL